MNLIFFTIKRRKSTRNIYWVALFSCLFFTSTHSLAASLVTVISSGNNHYHKSLVKHIKKDISNTNIKIKTINIDLQERIDIIQGLVISIGDKARGVLGDSNVSLPQINIVTHVKNNKTEKPTNIHYLSMTQSICNQFSLIKSLNRKWSNIGVLLSTDNPSMKETLMTCAQKHKLSVKIIIISQYVNIIDALNTSLKNSDALLALPDSSVYNAKTIKSILLTTYRHRVPIIGYTESLVRAGALASIHSSTKKLSKQIIELIREYNRSKLPLIIYPKYFDIAVNTKVARSLGISLPDKSLILKRLKANND